MTDSSLFHPGINKKTFDNSLLIGLSSVFDSLSFQLEKNGSYFGNAIFFPEAIQAMQMLHLRQSKQDYTVTSCSCDHTESAKI